MDPQVLVSNSSTICLSPSWFGFTFLWGIVGALNIGICSIFNQIRALWFIWVEAHGEVRTSWSDSGICKRPMFLQTLRWVLAIDFLIIASGSIDSSHSMKIWNNFPIISSISSFSVFLLFRISKKEFSAHPGILGSWWTDPISSVFVWGVRWSNTRNWTYKVLSSTWPRLNLRFNDKTLGSTK